MILQNDFVIGIANDFMAPGVAWVLVIVSAGAVRGDPAHARAVAHEGPGCATDPDADRRAPRGRAGAAALGDRGGASPTRTAGIPYAALLVGALFLFWTYVLNRTRFGRHIYAVGGNAEAARRAGIDVDRVKIACFAICSFMAVLGGIVLASRLRSVDTNTGGGQALLYPIAAAVIGGTSLFGGRGTMKAAMLGALVMLSIDNGLGLLGLSSGTKFVLTGGVLLLAVTVDSISRRGPRAVGTSMNQAGAVRWGILSTARINRKLLAGARLASNVDVVAVGSRDRAPRRGVRRRARHRARARLLRGAARRPRGRGRLHPAARTRCTCRGRCARWRPASTSCARSR